MCGSFLTERLARGACGRRNRQLLNEAIFRRQATGRNNGRGEERDLGEDLLCNLLFDSQQQCGAPLAKSRHAANMIKGSGLSIVCNCCWPKASGHFSVLQVTTGHL